MQRILLVSLLAILFSSCADNHETRLLLITGGHEIDHEHFVGVFDSIADVTYDEAVQPLANEVYGSDSIDQYDVLVFYDLVQEISDEQKTAFIDMLNRGKGIVFLHHSIASYQDWDEFLKILGGRYHLGPWKLGQDSMPASTYLDGQDVMAQIVDPKHPVTKGLFDFIIHDEVYDLFEVLPDVHPLIKTNHPKSGQTLVWTNKYGQSRIVYIQFGHDNNAFSNPNYRILVEQAIQWVK